MVFRVSPRRFTTLLPLQSISNHFVKESKFIIMIYDVSLGKEGEGPVESWFVTDNISNDMLFEETGADDWECTWMKLVNLCTPWCTLSCFCAVYDGQ